ncbi:MAG: hypothetical protein A2075_16985 [Geobacteraceae bacterium GWC2_58_44]|nr:MAG: hypothetical protein A2075_16985 [Geobacteraceae bacterium GWC2_58_44]
MLKKGLVTLVCLTVMSAVWSWAATTYSVRTQLTNPGGSIKVLNNTLTTTGIKYTNCTSAVKVVVTPSDGFTISSLKKINGATVTTIPVVFGTATTVTIAKPRPVDKYRPAVLPAQGVTATFASTNPGTGLGKTWQLQVQNMNGGGTISTDGPSTEELMWDKVRTKKLTDYATVGVPKLINFIDNRGLTATVNAKTGYKIRKIVTTGTVVFSNHSTLATVSGIPATDKLVNTVLATYQKRAFIVTTNSAPFTGTTTPGVPAPRFAPNGIAPVNPSVAYGGTVRLIITPTGANNLVESIAISPISGGSIALTDRFGAPVSLATKPFRGPVKATISNITSDIVVTATYDRDNTDEMQNCTSTCHLNARPAVQEVAFQWYSSTHRESAIDCVTCHSYMPGNVTRTTVSSHTFQIISSNVGGDITTRVNYCAKCHNGGKASEYVAAHAATVGYGSFCVGCHITLHDPDEVPDIPVSNCSDCHQTVAAKFATSLHGTRPGKATFYNDGLGEAPESLQQGFGNFVNVAYDNLSCVDCHNAAATTVNGVDTWTVASCADCHNSTTDTSEPVAMETCLGCHSRQKNERMAANLGGFGLTDVHLNGGMMNGKPFTCTTCHSTTDMHGDGGTPPKASMFDPGAITANCKNCHSVGSLSAVPEHTQHLNNIDCSTCHMQSVVTCYNCHFDNEAITDGSVTHAKFASAKFGGQGANSWRFLVNRVFPDGNGGTTTKVFPGTMQSLMADKTAKDDGLDDGEGITFVSIVPYYSHSITKVAALKCAACHGTPTAINLASNPAVAVDVVKWNPADDFEAAWPILAEYWKGPKGVIPVPENLSLLKFDFVDLVTPTAAWNATLMDVESSRVLFKRGADNIHMMEDYVKPLTNDQLKALKVLQPRP